MDFSEPTGIFCTIETMVWGMEERNRQYLVTLVHGTFARGAAWTQEGSFFRQQLETALGPCLAFSRFDWSGENSHSAREDAAKDLAARIRALAHANPAFEQYLICHSHGGNVALRAMCRDDAPQCVRGIVTLGTPFIVCRPRNLTTAIRALGWAIPFSFFILIMPILAVGIGVPGIGWLGEKYGPLVGGLALFLGPPITALTLVILAIKIRRWTKSRLADWIVRKQQESLEKLRAPKLEDIEVLSLYVKHDEAGTWLNILEFTGNLFHRFHILNRVLIIICGLALVAAAVLSGAYEEYELALDIAGYDLWFLFIATVILYVLVGPALGLFPWLIRGHKFGFGGETVFDNMLTRITAERKLDSVMKSFSVEVAPKISTGLNHSSFYNELNVSAIVVGWIRDRRIDQSKVVSKAKWIPYIAQISYLTPYLASLIIVTGFLLARWPQYQSAHHLESDPVDWRSRFPELDGRPVSSVPVLQAQNYETTVTKPFQFSIGRGNYCALVGYVRSTNGNKFALEVIRRASFGAYLAGRVRAAYKSPHLKNISLHIPLPEQETYLLRIYGVRLWTDAVVNADVSVVCWNTPPKKIPVPFQGL
jgi:hypothetical protein